MKYVWVKLMHGKSDSSYTLQVKYIKFVPYQACIVYGSL